MNEANTKTPMHLWIIGILSLLWNAVGAFDYSATQLRLESYMSQFTAEQLEFFYGFPAWTKAFWAIALFLYFYARDGKSWGAALEVVSV
jgi:hypothetical protein